MTTYNAENERAKRRYFTFQREAKQRSEASIDAIAKAALDVRSDIIVLCHGGPIAEPADATLVLSKTRHCQGFYGASSMERLPAEKAITKQTQDFKRITF